MSAFNRLLIVTTGGVGLLFLAVYEFANRLEIYTVADPLDALFGNSPRGFLMHVFVYGFLAVGIGLHFQDIVLRAREREDRAGARSIAVMTRDLASLRGQPYISEGDYRHTHRTPAKPTEEEADILDWSL